MPPPNPQRGVAPKPRFFRSSVEFRQWLHQHHATADVLWVGFFKRSTGKARFTWTESVDEALCYGWIDGIRKSVDGSRYTIRFTPRRRASRWSAVNVRRARTLIREGRMRPAGLRAFRARPTAKQDAYSYENRPADLPAAYLRRLRADRRAWAFWRSQPRGYRRTATWWILSAKQESTRLRRLSTLMEDSREGNRIPLLSRRPREK
jgi:uncharacterized protein YdeI (YjbR/CyaY-like superfamily)